MSAFLIVIAVAIVVTLSVYAWTLHTKVKQKEANQKAQLLELEKQKQEHKNYLNNSIQVLAQGLIDDQLSLTEGAIRISVLMDNCQITEETKKEFVAFFQLAEETAHIPILDAWKRLSKKEKFKYDNERGKIEDKYKDFVVDAAQRIRGRSF
jgi:Na+/H+ antiporter NhaB